MNLTTMNRVPLTVIMAIFLSGAAICSEDHSLVINVQVINEDDGQPLAGKEISLFRWKSYFSNVASKRYLINKRTTDLDGRVSFLIDRRNSLDLRFLRCPGDIYGMIYALKDDDFIKSGRDIVLTYSVSKCIKTFG
jgi:hypothetical protein